MTLTINKAVPKTELIDAVRKLSPSEAKDSRNVAIVVALHVCDRILEAKFLTMTDAMTDALSYICAAPFTADDYLGKKIDLRQIFSRAFILLDSLEVRSGQDEGTAARRFAEIQKALLERSAA